MFAPDRTLYPEYDEYLEKSMIAETTGFSARCWSATPASASSSTPTGRCSTNAWRRTTASRGVTGEPMRRVALAPEDHRGGLLTHASVLSLSSDGTRHRPVHRGVWVLESILNRPPPPPPANVPALPTPSAKAKKTTVREKLELHRADPTCAGCHRRIDPLGLAFDNYDAIGRWRTVETVRDGTGGDPAIDASGELIDGRKFADARGLKKLLLDDTDRFAAAFLEKLATYALRRGMTFRDRAELKKLAEQSKPDGYRLATLVESLALSDLFRRR